MGIVKEEIKTFKVDYICDNCSECEMIFGGETLTSYPPQYPHTCPKCGFRKNLSKVYPSIEYEKI